MSQRLLMGLALVLSLTSWSEAARKTSADQPITVRLELHYMVSILFPEPIDKVMTPGKVEGHQAEAGGSPQLISVEAYAHVLGIELVQPEAVGRLLVIGESGKTYPVNFKPGSPGDDVVEVVAQHRQEDQARPFTVISFMRALKLGQALPGQRPEPVTLPALPDERLRILDAQAVGMPQGVGIVLHVENTQRNSLALDIRVSKASEPQEHVVALNTWDWPPGLTLRLVHVDQAQIPAGGQTHIFLVFERRS